MFNVSAGGGPTASSSKQHCMPPRHSGAQSEAAHSEMQPAQNLSLSDLQMVTMDIKSTLAAVIRDLKADIQSIATRMLSVEQASACHADAIRQVQKNSDMHLSHIIELHRHIEDLDNLLIIEVFEIENLLIKIL